MRDSRMPTEMLDESQNAFFCDTLPPAKGCRADGCRPRVSPAEGKAGKRTNGFCTPPAYNQEEKAARSPVFPRFPHARERLCGKNFSSLRQEENFFQQRNPVFAARKRASRRRNVPYGQFLSPFFNTLGAISALPPCRTGVAYGGETFVLAGNRGI